MNAARFTLNNTRTVLVLYAVAILFGVHTFLTIGRLEMPEFTIRNAVIITNYAGRTTVQVEQEVTEPIEQAIRQLAEVKQISSTSKPGISIVTVEIDERYFDMEDIWTDVRHRLGDVELPQGASRPRINDDFGEVFPYVFALRGDGFTFGELSDVAEGIRDEILALDGVAKVEFHGNQEERVYLEFSSSELSAYGVSPDRVMASISAQNMAASSGSLKTGPERLNLVTLGEFESLEELADYQISSPGETSSLRVSDVLDIERSTIDPPRSFTHFNGERVLCIAVSMIEGGVVTEIGERVRARMDQIEATLPVGLDIETMFYQPRYVQDSIRNFIVNLGQAFFFVVLVMLSFAGWRIALIVGILVPSAILCCFSLMPAAGVLLEMMSIAALIIALGLLVDNAVVVSEQILVRLDEGQDRRSAVIDSVSSLSLSLLAATGTTIAAFSPIALASGNTAEFTFSLFAVVSLTLLSSWVLSLTVIPLFCYFFLRPLKRDTPVGLLFNRLYAPYEASLRALLRLKWGYPALILALTLAAALGFRQVPNILFPPNERGQFVIDVNLPLGTAIEETEDRVRAVEDWLLQEHADVVQSVSAWIGDGGPRWYLALSPEQANPNYAFLSVITHTEDPREIKKFVDRVNRHGLDSFPSARINAKPLENGPPVGDPIQLRLYGEDLATLYQLRERIMLAIREVPGLYDLRDSWGAWTKQVSIDPDPVRSARLGLDTRYIADALNLQFDGTRVTHYREGTDSIPVIMRSRDDYRTRPERIPDLPIFAPQGVVPLSQVADTRVEFLPGSILREDTVRVMTLKGKVRGRYSSEVLAEVRPIVDEITARDDWPRGYRIEYGGEQEESAEAQGGIAAGMPLSMAALALILIAQFNSIRRFAIIVLTIPPMLCGVVPGLLLTRSTFGFMTLLGMIALIGIIVNNAILLIDEMDRQVAGGSELFEAIVDAARSRPRPIIMTTLTTIIGLLPLALGGGGMWSSMAFAMMFGLGFATLLTLFLCPVLYFLFFGKSFSDS